MKRPYTQMLGRCFMFCKAAKLVEANTMAGIIDPDAGGENTFFLECNSKDALPTDEVTHFAANTAIDEQMDSDIKATGPTITKYFEADGWTFETALNDMWLQRLN